MAQNGTSSSKPTVLILGGLGFIGRNLVHYLVTNEVASKIRVADKVMPPLAWLSPAHKESFKQVEFKHANLINPKSVSSAFQPADGSTFDFVINCAAETKPGQTEAVYRDGIYKLSCNCAREAAKHRVKGYIELSTAHMHSTDKEPIKEDIHCDPWTQQAKYKLLVEQELPAIPTLNYIVVRPAMVYGPSNKTGLATTLVIGGVYKYLKEKMKLLWGPDLKMNTVHVHDLVRALWHLCLHGNPGETYHLADSGNTTQRKIGDLISEIFNINHDYLGVIASNMAKLSIDDVVEDVNDKHMTPWGEICQLDGIQNTPLNPCVAEEHLLNKHLYVNGHKIEQTGYTYDQPQITKQLLLEVLEEYVSMGLFPPSLLQTS